MSGNYINDLIEGIYMYYFMVLLGNVIFFDDVVDMQFKVLIELFI